MDRGAWQATVRVVRESDMTEQLSTHAQNLLTLTDDSPVLCNLLFIPFNIF